VLSAPNPFDSEDVITGCPNCKEVNRLRSTCDEPNCWEADSMGIATPNGYRRTCYAHRPKEWDAK
jgi:hypothetical protein